MRAQLTLIVAGALLAAGCGRDETPAEAPANGDETLEVAGRHSSESARGTFHVVITRENGEPIPLNEPFAVTLELSAPDGTPWTSADMVTLDARMPAHRHGMLRDVELEEVGPGRYRADGLLFHMIGHWEFHVDVVQGPRVERATADVWLEL